MSGKRHLQVFTGKEKNVFLTINETPKARTGVVLGPQCLTQYNICVREKKKHVLDMPKNRTENPHASTQFLTQATP